MNKGADIFAVCPDAGKVELKQICMFFADYASWLLGCGATCIRIERNINRMATALGCEVVMTILPRHVHITVNNPDHSDNYTYIAATRKVPINYDMNTRLSELSWALCDGKISYDDTIKLFHHIVNTKYHNRWMILILASFANAAFCRLFSGDWYAVAVVFFTTIIGFLLKQTLASLKVDVRVIFIICSFVSSLIAAQATLFSVGLTPAVAIGTSVLYLVPGIPFLNSFSDLLDGHYICAFSRFIHATVLTCCLSLGLCAAMLITNISMF